MSLIKINRNPSEKDLRWFTLLWFPLFMVALAAVLWWRAGLGDTAAMITGGVGIVLGLAGFAVRPLGRMIWIVIMTITFPIGFILSQVILFVMYYLVMTPIGLIMRMFGYDPMHRSFEPDAKTYWLEHRPSDKPKQRYFRQF